MIAVVLQQRCVAVYRSQDTKFLIMGVADEPEVIFTVRRSVMLRQVENR